MSLAITTTINNEIKNKLFEIAFVVSCFNKSGYNDISKYAESYFQQIFNIVFQKKDGKRTHYFNTKYDIDSWYKDKNFL